MTDRTDRQTVTDADLDAFVDGQLDPVRRIAVAETLAGRPDLATRVMADVSTREALRLSLHPLPPAPPALLGAARRLERGLVRGRAETHLRRAAAIVVLVGAGWLAHSQAGGFVTPGIASHRPPAFVEDALVSHQTARLDGRAGAPAAEQAALSSEAAEAALPMPELPPGWSVESVRVVDTAGGPGIEALLDAGRLGTVSLFAARPGGFDVVTPVTTREDGLTAAYWQVGEVAYALIGQSTAQGGDADLARAASGLSKALY